MAVNLVLILERRLAKACSPHSVIRRIEMLNMLPVLSSWLHCTAQGLCLYLAAAEERGVGCNKDQRERGLAQSGASTKWHNSNPNGRLLFSAHYLHSPLVLHYSAHDSSFDLISLLWIPLCSIFFSKNVTSQVKRLKGTVHRVILCFISKGFWNVFFWFIVSPPVCTAATDQGVNQSDVHVSCLQENGRTGLSWWSFYFPQNVLKQVWIL